MSNLPRKITIGGHDYKIKHPYKFVERTDVDGQCDSGMLEIRVKGEDRGGNPIEPSVKMNILLHEIIHAMDEVTGSERLPEQKTEAFSQVALQVLTANGWCPTWFCEEFMKCEVCNKKATYVSSHVRINGGVVEYCWCGDHAIEGSEPIRLGGPK